MKIILLAVSLVLLSAGARAQDAAGPSPLVVVEQKWRFQIRNPAMDENPLLAADARVAQEQDIRDTAGVDNPSGKLGIKGRRKTDLPQSERKDEAATAVYVYRIKLKNTGAKDVRKLTLEYVFFDPESKREVGRRRFSSEDKISAGKTRNLIFSSVSPPTGAVSAVSAGKKTDQKYAERVVVRRIEYADGSKWENPAEMK